MELFKTDRPVKQQTRSAQPPLPEMVELSEEDLVAIAGGQEGGIGSDGKKVDV